MQVELVDIHKHYGPLKANDGISLTFASGKLHGILGENGAGKSTLMKILSGFCQRTSGKILLDGNPIEIDSTLAAARLGIGMLYQDPLDFHQLSVLENFMLGLTERPSLQRAIFRKRLARSAETFHFNLNPDAALASLTLGERQQLELLRLLALGIKMLILDEPTTGISTTQKHLLYGALRRLAHEEHKTVLLVSHKLEDVEALCDRVSVLRHGRVAGSMAHPFDTRSLMEMMFGQPPGAPPVCTAEPGEEVLACENIACSGGRAGLQRCSVRLRQGEIVGLAGLEGSGQEVFLRLACGLKTASSGILKIAGEDLTRCNYIVFKNRGVAFLPTARLEEGLVSGMTVSEHAALLQPRTTFWLRRRAAALDAAIRIERFRIKGEPETPVDELSGGNQQRLLLSVLPPNPLLLLLENPTRGLDVDSTQWVWSFLKAHCDRRTCIVFSSPELDEILQVANRVLVFFNGRIIKDVHSRDTNAQALGFAIAGKP